jgi:hypothetical protein
MQSKAKPTAAQLLSAANRQPNKMDDRCAHLQLPAILQPHSLFVAHESSRLVRRNIGDRRCSPIPQ